MPEPIEIRVTAELNPSNANLLNVSVNHRLLFLSANDDDRVRFICEDGYLTITFPPQKNPFDPNAYTATEYHAGPGSPYESGPLALSQLPTDPEEFAEYEYLITVVSPDGLRAGNLDPTFRPRRSSVYSGHSKA